MPFLVISPKLSIHYLDLNPGGSRTVLLLHGLGADCTSWTLQLPALDEAGFRVLAPDVRGFGRSTYPGGQLSVSNLAADMKALLDFLKAGAVDVVGISMGGTIALQFALDYPDSIDRLILVNTFARLRPQRLGIWFYFALRIFLVHTLGLSTQAKIVARRIFPRPDQSELRRILYEQIRQANPAGYRAAIRALARYNALPHLNRLKIPTLVITGALDNTVPAEIQRELSVKIPGAQQIVISKAGHAVIVDQAVAFNRRLLEFLLEEDDNL